jgi:sugar/nucleoside kinase (ribokinase family)
VGANGRVVEEDVREELVEGTKLIHIGGALILPALDGEPLARALRRAKERGLKTSVDTAWDDRGRWMEALAPALPHVDYFLPSIEEARMLTGRREPPEVAEALLEAGAKTVALKMGVGGCYLRAGEQEVRLPAYEVESVDSTGAGDAFVAGFLFGVLRGWDLESCGRLGNAAGALCTRAVGTTEGLRGLEETLDFARRAKVRDEG